MKMKLGQPETCVANGKHPVLLVAVALVGVGTVHKWSHLQLYVGYKPAARGTILPLWNTYSTYSVPHLTIYS